MRSIVQAVSTVSRVVRSAQELRWQSGLPTIAARQLWQTHRERYSPLRCKPTYRRFRFVGHLVLLFVFVPEFEACIHVSAATTRFRPERDISLSIN